MDLFNLYDSSEMAFNPAIPSPRPVDVHKYFKGRHSYTDEAVESRCKDALHMSLDAKTPFLDFYNDCIKNWSWKKTFLIKIQPAEDCLNLGSFFFYWKWIF